MKEQKTLCQNPPKPCLKNIRDQPAALHETEIIDSGQSGDQNQQDERLQQTGGYFLKHYNAHDDSHQHKHVISEILHDTNIRDY